VTGRDPIGQEFYVPLRTAERLSDALFYLAAALSIDKLHQERADCNLEGKVAVVTGPRRASDWEVMLAAGSRVVMVDRDEAALKVLCDKHGDAVIPLVIDLLDPKDCATLLPRVLREGGRARVFPVRRARGASTGCRRRWFRTCRILGPSAPNPPGARTLVRETER
jgi:hypothetical protein